MLLGILVVMILLAVGAFLLLRFVMKRNVLSVVVPVIILALLTGIIVIGGLHTVNAGHVLLVKEWGRAKEVKGAGLNFVNPITSTTEDYSIQTQQIDMEFQAYSMDAQSMEIKMAMQYAIDPTKVVEIAERYGSASVLREKITRVIEEKAKTVFSSKSAMKIIETRETLGPAILASTKELESEYHITITAAAASDITFNDAFENAVENKMIAEQAKLQAQYDKEKALIKADEQLEVAKKEAESVIAKANGDAEALSIMQKAWSSLSGPVKEAMLRQQFYEKWNGILPQVVSDASLIYDLGSATSLGQLED